MALLDDTKVIEMELANALDNASMAGMINIHERLAVNAGKHVDEDSIDMYVRVDLTEVSAFVSQQVKELLNSRKINLTSFELAFTLNNKTIAVTRKAKIEMVPEIVGWEE